MNLAAGEADLAGNLHNDGASAALLTQPPLINSRVQDPPLGRAPLPPHARTNERAADIHAAKGDLPTSCIYDADAALFGIYQD